MNSEKIEEQRDTLYQAELFPLISHVIKANAVKNSTERNFSSHSNISEISSDQNTAGQDSKSKNKSSKKVKLPAIPPKKLTTQPNMGETEEQWYFVRSPREEYGAQGPHNIEELKQYKKLGILKDSTLMWQDGLKLWMPLGSLTSLKTNLVKLPKVPDRLTEQAAYDPIAAPPTREQIQSCEKLEINAKSMMSRFCSKCGATAVGHLPQTAHHQHDQDLPDFNLLRRSIGSYQNASEVIPGLVWIGNSSTGRSKFFSDLGVDLILNCTSNLKTPESKPPYYRCATIPLPEEKSNEENKTPALSRAGTSSFFSRANSSALSRTDSMESIQSDNEDITLSRMNSTVIQTRMELTEVLEWFEKCYDQIENLRLYPDRAREADPAPYDWTGPVDRYGRPIRTKEEIAIATATRKLIDENEGRDKKVLLWSRLGFDRPCVLAAAYLVRRWGITVDSALDCIRKGRKGMKVSEYYLSALRKYGEMHTIGELLCADCLCHQTIPLTTTTTTVTVTVPIAQSDQNSNSEIITTTTEKKSEAYRIAVPKNSLEEAIMTRISSMLPSSSSPSSPSSSSPSSSISSKLGLHPLNSFFCHRPYPSSYRLTTLAAMDDGLNGPEFSTLIDVKITGKLLHDEDLIDLVKIFQGAQILRQLHLIDLSDNHISCDGITALCEALDEEESPEVAILLLRNNRIGPRGAKMITKLLESKFNLHTLNLANNQIGDAGGLAIINALILPEKDLFDADEYKDPDAVANASLYSTSIPGSTSRRANVANKKNVKAEEKEEDSLIKNSTLTHLDLSNNSIGRESLESLAMVMKSNLTLLSLNLDCLPTSRGGNYLNHIFDECRAFNKSLRRISLTDSLISVNTFDHLMRVFDGSSVLQQVNLTRCDLTALHLRKSIVKVTFSSHLTHLILSGNKLTDQGVGFISDIFDSTAGRTGPPLKCLDLSTCGMTIASAIPLLRAISSKQTMRSVDLSDNNLHGTISQMKELTSSLPSSSLHHLNLSRCQLGVHGSISLFTSILNNQTFKTLILSENDIQDSVDGPLSEYLQTNTSLEVLDLGYNSLTSNGLKKSKQALRIESTSSLERKLFELHINLIGNPCGPYELEFPGMARSKNLLRYGQERLDGDEFRYHISHSAYEDYWQRRKFGGKINPEKWTEINSIA